MGHSRIDRPDRPDTTVGAVTETWVWYEIERYIAASALQPGISEGGEWWAFGDRQPTIEAALSAERGHGIFRIVEVTTTRRIAR